MALRHAKLYADPLCQACQRQGRTVEAREVDHIRRLADGGTDDWANLQSLCLACHNAKTLAERGAVRSGADASGWPADAAHPWNQPARG